MRTSVLTCARALGPQGGWGIHGALRKILLIPLLLSSFPCFSSAFASRLLHLFLFFDYRATFPPSESHLQPNSLISAQFSQNALSPVPFPLWLTFAFVFFKRWSCSLEPPKRPKDIFLSLTVEHLIDSGAFAFGSKFHPALFFYHTFLLHVLAAPAFSTTFFLLPRLHFNPPPPLFSLSDASFFPFSPTLWHLLSPLFCHDPAHGFPPPS